MVFKLFLKCCIFVLSHGTFQYIYVNEGWRAFFHGAMVNAMRGTGAALVLALYNEMAKYM